MKNQAPWPVTGMRLMVLILALWNGLRLSTALLNWSTLAEMAPQPGPLYIAGSASLWILACAAVAYAIRRRNAQSQAFYALLVLGYLIWWWADRLLFSQTERPNWPFTLAITVILLLDTLANYLNKTAKDYFTQRESHDQQHSNQPTP